MLEELERLREVVGEEHGQALAEMEAAVRAHLAAAEERDERLRVLEEAQRRLEAVEVELRDREGAVDVQAGEIAGLKKGLETTLEAYRKATRAQVPSAAELIVGSTVGEIDASLERARGVVAKVEAEVRERLAAEKVPAGAPERTGPDLSEMSPAEKIRYGLGLGIRD